MSLHYGLRSVRQLVEEQTTRRERLHFWLFRVWPQSVVDRRLAADEAARRNPWMLYHADGTPYMDARDR
jgi:hypothetical protein